MYNSLYILCIIFEFRRNWLGNYGLSSAIAGMKDIFSTLYTGISTLYRYIHYSMWIEKNQMKKLRMY